jgi:hypothetical protein
MGLPIQPVTLSAEQIDELNRKLSTMRHDINNNLSLIIAALELIQHKPEVAERMIATIGQQPPKIGAALGKFSAEFEKAMGVTRK